MASGPLKKIAGTLGCWNERERSGKKCTHISFDWLLSFVRLFFFICRRCLLPFHFGLVNCRFLWQTIERVVMAIAAYSWTFAKLHATKQIYTTYTNHWHNSCEFVCVRACVLAVGNFNFFFRSLSVSLYFCVRSIYAFNCKVLASLLYAKKPKI